MTKRRKFAAMSGTAIAAALALASVSGLPGHLAATLLAEGLENASAHHLRISGDVGIALWPSPSFTAQDVAFAEGEDPTRSLRLEAPSLRLSIAWEALLTGTSRITDIELSHPALRLPLSRLPLGAEQALGAEGAAGAKDALADWLEGGRLDHLLVSDGTVTLFDATSGATSRLDHLEAAVASARPGQALGIEAEALWNGQRVSFQARGVPSPQGRRDEAEDAPQPVNFLLQAPGFVPTVAGVARARFADQRLVLTDLKGMVGSDRFTGGLEADFSAVKPKLHGAFQAGRVMMSWPSDRAPTRAHATSAAPSGAAPTDAGWSDRPWRLDLLNYVDANVTLGLDGFGFDKAGLEPIAVEAKLAQGSARIALASLGTGARMEADVGLDASGAWPTFRMHGKSQVARLLPLLHQALGIDAIDGRAAVAFDVGASGDTLRGVMASMTGSAEITLEDGRIRAFDPLHASARSAAGLVSNAAEAFDIAELSARFRLDHGRAVSQDLHLSSRVLDLDGSGMIDLAERRLALKLDPNVVRSIPTGSAAASVASDARTFLIAGPWNAPIFSAETEAGAAADDRSSDAGRAPILQDVGLVTRGAAGQSPQAPFSRRGKTPDHFSGTETFEEFR